MNKLFSVKLWTILTEILVVVFVLALIVTQVANQYEVLINVQLKLSGYEPVTVGDENVDTEYFKNDFETFAEMREYADKVAEEAEAEGLVLLKNEENALPLKKGSKVSAFMTGSVQFNFSAQGKRDAKDYGDKIDVKPYPTLKEAMERSGTDLSVNPDLWEFYKSGPGSAYGGKKQNNIFYINEAPWSAYNKALKDTFAAYGDAAVVVLTRDSNEGTDMDAAGSDGEDGNYLALSPAEVKVLQELTALRNNGTFGKIIVILNSAAALQLDFLYRNDITVDACLWVGNVGSAGMYAVADALVGDVIPSGRLADTFLKDNFSSPAMASWIANDGRSFSQEYGNAELVDNDPVRKNYAVYVEGIYVGYRYYETRYADYVEGRGNAGDYKYNDDVAFPFGYGLSYADFAYDNFAITGESDDTYTVSVDVENLGPYDAKEVVQIYLQKPYDEAYDTEHLVEKAAVELAGFAKTDIIAAGDTATVEVTVEKETFKTYDTNNHGTYILGKGDYYLAIGKNAHDALNNILAAKGFGKSSGMDSDGDSRFALKALSRKEIDLTKYAVSTETTGAVTNRLADMDINRYAGRGENATTYVSRSDWTGTWLQAAEAYTLNEQMSRDLQNLTIDDIKDDGSAPPTYGADNGLSLIMLRSTEELPIAFKDPIWELLLDQMTFEEQNTLLTTAYCKTAGIKSITKPQTNEMDGPTYCKEGKTGVRFPCEGIWASSFNLEVIEKIGYCMANEALITPAAKDQVFTGMWIPGINMHRTPYGGRVHEYFSEDPLLTGIAAAAEIRGIQGKGVIAYPKHYVFNDAEDNRSGVGVWLNEQSAREIYLEPWRYAVSPKRGNAHGIMSSFNRAGCKWSSASAALMQGILRDEFGFDGFVITDMAEANGTSYMCVLDGIMAGTELWLSQGNSHDLTPYKNNAVVANKMRRACHRVLYNIANSAGMNGYSSNTKMVPVLTWWQSLLIAVDVVSGVLAAGALVMLILGKRRKTNDR